MHGIDRPLWMVEMMDQTHCLPCTLHRIFLLLSWVDTLLAVRKAV